MKGLRDKFLKWKEALQSKGWKINLGETKVMVSSVITNDRLSKSKVDPCGVCSLRVKANSVVTPKLSRNITCRKCEGNIGDAVKQ